MNSNHKTSSDAEPLFNRTKPRVGSSRSAIVGVSVLFIFVAVVGSIYLHMHSGGFDSRVYPAYASIAALEDAQPPRPPPPENSVYLRTCAPCHQPDGAGVPGVFPPLRGSEWILTPGPARAIHIVLDGMSGPVEVKGEQFNSVMVPWRDGLTDEDIASVLTYVRGVWGNNASAVTAEQVKQVREATSSQAGTPWTAADLRNVSAGE